MDIRDRIQQLLTAINQEVYEKDTELGLSLLAALAGESVLCWVLRGCQIHGGTQTEGCLQGEQRLSNI